MPKRIKPDAYLFLSAYIHSKETKLVDRVRLDRMLDAHSTESALKALEEIWSFKFDIEATTAAELEPLLAKRRSEVFADLANLAPDPAIVDAFRAKYDYHNAKVLVKSQAANSAADGLLSSSGRLEPTRLAAAFRDGDLRSIPSAMAAAIRESVDALAKTGDPQIADFILDKAYFAELAELGVRSGSEFLRGYVTLAVDVANLRTAVRARRSGQELTAALIDGGTVTAERIRSASDNAELLALFSSTALKSAAESAAEVLEGASLTAFELATDNALIRYLAQAKRATYSERPLIGYLGAIESEISAVRIVMTGQFAGLEPSLIRARLRECY
ncbi:MAG: V-type ATPase subunit [Oscillospiraceae bacterium]|jgi:V/A-type H+-transporting ATPase subunit C|nr:V-type ATPase subunit [Oscillospiraceae bacterium]